MEFNGEYICQEVILQRLFFGCATESTGFVKVSKLIDYLSLAVNTGDNVEFRGNFDDLLFLLDPEGKNVEVDFETYQKGMEDWIDGIRCQSYDEEIAKTQNSSPYSDSCATNATQANVSALDHSDIQGDGAINNSSESVEGVGGESPDKQDSWELITKIEDLQLNNRRIADRNTELSFQMENTEETNAQLLQEIERLRKQLRSFQKLDETNITLEKENMDFRQKVIELQENRKKVLSRVKKLERDKITLNEFQEELQTKLGAAHRRLESLSNDHKSVCVAYNEEKQKLIELEELQGIKEEIDKESTNRYDYMTNIIADLTAQKEALQAEKRNMEAELSQVREELSILMVRNHACSRNMYTLPGQSFTSVSSLQQEIQELSYKDCLPSPLVGYSILNYSYESDVFDSSHNSQNQISLLSLSPLNSTFNSPSSTSNEVLAAVNQVAVGFREKKEKVLHAISELVRLDKTRETREIREALQNELEKELEFFAEKIQLLSLSRKATEKRVSKLLASITILKEEKKQLVEERERTLQKATNSSVGSDDLRTRIESLTSELEATLEKAKTFEKRCGELQSEINETNSQLQRNKLENESLASSLEVKSNAGREAERQFQEISRLYNNLEKEHESVLAKIGKLERDLKRTSSDLNVETKRSFDLQESLSLSVSKHEQELEDIMETIPNAIYTEQENRTFSKSKPSAITGYQVRTKLHDFLTNIHSTTRESPDGKPISHNDKIPLGVSTPLDGSNTNLNSRQPFQCHLTSISQSILNDNSKNSLAVDASHNQSWNSIDDGRSYTDSSTSIVSPNLIQPFEDDDSLLSPNLIHPFEGNHKTNITYTTTSNGIKEFQEGLWKGTVFNSFGGRESQVTNIQSLDHESSTTNCTRNLAKDFSVEARRQPNCTISLTSSQYSENSDDNDVLLPVPVSPVIPQRFLEFANGTCNNGMCSTKTKIELQELEVREAMRDCDDSSKKTLKENSLFSFENLDIERCLGKSDSSRISSRLTSSSCDGDCAVLEGYDSDYKLSPNTVNSFIDGVSFNSNLPSDENELEKLFKSVSLAFRTDKATLSQRLEYQERARDTAEGNVVKGLQCLNSGLKRLEKTVSSNSDKQIFKKSLDSLYEQIMLLKESCRRLSTQSHQFGCYQQEARMISGVNVLITYGETLSRRFETALSESFTSKEIREDDKDNPRMQGKRSSEVAEELHDSSRRGSAFYNFMTSMRPKDGFGLFGSGEAPKMLQDPSDEDHAAHEQSNHVDDQANDQPLETNTETAQVYENIRNKTVKERCCLNRCLCWTIKLIMYVIVAWFVVLIVVENSVIDRDFIREQLLKKLNRFVTRHYEQEPPV